LAEARVPVAELRRSFDGAITFSVRGATGFADTAGLIRGDRVGVYLEGPVVTVAEKNERNGTTSRIAEIEADDGRVVRIIDGPTATSGIGRCLDCDKRWTSQLARRSAQKHTTETGHRTLVDTIRFRTETFEGSPP
jgi:hypothetical protein